MIALGVLLDEPVDRGLSAIGRSVVHDPVHLIGSNVGFGGHDLSDQVGKSDYCLVPVASPAICTSPTR
jgi:hypothetical protein